MSVSSLSRLCAEQIVLNPDLQLEFHRLPWTIQNTVLQVTHHLEMNTMVKLREALKALPSCDTCKKWCNKNVTFLSKMPKELRLFHLFIVAIDQAIAKTLGDRSGHELIKQLYSMLQLEYPRSCEPCICQID